MIETKRGYKFESSGREFYANGFIGIHSGLDIAQGYDGCIDPEPGNKDYSLDLTKEERIELADYMIGLWSEYKKQG